jgi:putative ABC transport system permease protein
MTLATIGRRNIARNKTRTLLTILGIAVAVVAFLFLRTVSVSWSAGGSTRAVTRIMTRHRISLSHSLPKKYASEVARIPHVKQTASGAWFGLRDPKRESDFFPSGATDEATLDVYEIHVTPAERETWLKDRQGLLVGRSIAKQMGWNVGDRVNLLSRAWPNPDGGWVFTVRGIYTSPSFDERWVWARYDYLNDSLPPKSQNRITWVATAVDAPEHAAVVIAAIDARFDSDEAPTLSQDEKTFSKGMLAAMSGIVAAADVISVVILAVMALLLGNTIAMSIRERTSEYGVLRALGFGSQSIVVLTVVEAVFTMFLGALLGLAIGVPLINVGLAPNVEKEMSAFLWAFRVPPLAIVTVLVSAVLLGVGAALLPTLRVVRIHTVDALRHVD